MLGKIVQDADKRKKCKRPGFIHYHVRCSYTPIVLACTHVVDLEIHMETRWRHKHRVRDAVMIGV
jgi:hypothetical protein